jgi:hypothetical protein
MGAPARRRLVAGYESPDKAIKACQGVLNCQTFVFVCWKGSHVNGYKTCFIDGHDAKSLEFRQQI